MSNKLDFTDILDFEKLINDKYDIKVHFYDKTNTFIFNEYKSGVNQFTREYFSVKNLLPLFSEDGLSFTLERIELC